MFGDKAIELIKELDRNPAALPPFNDEAMRLVLEEMNALYDENIVDVSTYSSATEQNDRNLYSTVQWRHFSIERNKRLILAYLYNRLMKIKTLRWEIGSVLSDSIKQNLSANEILWFHDYNKNLTSYMRSIGDKIGLDITQNTQPPKSLYIEVRCLCDYGEFETEDGAVLMKENTQHFLLRSEAEHLIRQGILEHIVS